MMKQLKMVGHHYPEDNFFTVFLNGYALFIIKCCTAAEFPSDPSQDCSALPIACHVCNWVWMESCTAVLLGWHLIFIHVRYNCWHMPGCKVITCSVHFRCCCFPNVPHDYPVPRRQICSESFPFSRTSVPKNYNAGQDNVHARRVQWPLLEIPLWTDAIKIIKSWGE